MPWYPLTCIACRKTAVYFNHKPVEGEIPRAKDARYPDGTAPNASEMATCPHCGAPVMFATSLIGPPEDCPFPEGAKAMQAKKCANCIYAEKSRRYVNTYYCHRFPERIEKFSDEWCGEFTPRKPQPHSTPPPSLREAADYAAYVLELASSNRSNDPENRRIYADAAAELRKAIERDEAAK